MINITLNGKEQEIPDAAYVGNILEERGFTKRVSVWVNGRQLLIAEFNNTQLASGDDVRIMRIVGGG